MAAHLPETSYSICAEYVTKAHNFYIKLEDAVAEQVERLLPDNLKPLARKVCRALPDALFSLSMISGKFCFAAALYGGARLVWAATPIITSLIKGSFTYELIKAAGNESLQRLMQLYEQFKPAIALSCSITAVYYGLFGTLTCDAYLLMQGLFIGLIGYTAYRSLPDEPPADKPGSDGYRSIDVTDTTDGITDTPIEGADTTFENTDTPIESTDTPVEGADTSIASAPNHTLTSIHNIVKFMNRNAEK